MPTRRYKLIVAYRGTRYHGWQRQRALPTYKGEREPRAADPAAPPGAPAPVGEDIPTIQGTLARTIGTVVGHPVVISGSSRTDAGVHAKGQVAHFDTDQLQIPPEGMRRAINHRLPSDVLVRSIDPVPNTFDSITSTRTKRYQFFIWNSPDRPLFFSDLAWHRWQYLDVPKMIRAAAHFAGEHDFASFARPGHGRENTIRTVLACEIAYRKPKLVIGVEGRGFLWNMVRIMVGTLVEVGLGRFEPEQIPEMLAAKDRQTAGSTAPPHGLYLQWIRTVGEEAPTSESGQPAAD